MFVDCPLIDYIVPFPKQVVFFLLLNTFLYRRHWCSKTQKKHVKLSVLTPDIIFTDLAGYPSSRILPDIHQAGSCRISIKPDLAGYPSSRILPDIHLAGSCRISIKPDLVGYLSDRILMDIQQAEFFRYPSIWVQPDIQTESRILPDNCQARSCQITVKQDLARYLSSRISGFLGDADLLYTFGSTFSH